MLTEVSKATRMKSSLDTNYLILDYERALHNSATNSICTQLERVSLSLYADIMEKSGKERLRTKYRIRLTSTMNAGFTLLVL